MATETLRIKVVGLREINKVSTAVNNLDKKIKAINKQRVTGTSSALKLLKEELSLKNQILKADQEILKARNNQTSANRRNIATQTGRTGGGSVARGGGAVQSALISGAFPLLFGQGPLGALAGGLGGGIGAAVGGQMGGFAGGLVATAALQQIQTTITAVGELGQALNPLTADLNKLTQAAGLAGTAEAARIRLLEQVEGKQAALAAATQNMALVIGDEGVRTVKEFGENFAAIRSNAAEFGLKLQERFAKIFNAIVDKFPSLFGEKGTAEEKKGLSEAVSEDPVSIALNAELLKIKADLDKLKQEIAVRDANIGIPNAPSFLKGGSTLFPSQMPDLATEVDKATKSSNLDENVRVAEQQLNSITKSLEKRKQSLKIQVDDNIALEKANNITDLILNSTKKNVEALKAKKNGTFEEFEIQQRVSEIVQKIKDLGIDENLINEEKIEKLIRQEKTLSKQVDTAKKLENVFAQMSVTIGNDIKNGIAGLIKGTSTLSDMLNNVANKFLDLALNQALFGDALGAGGKKGGGILGFLTGGLLANGGRAAGGKSFIVGEKGPELFVPKSSGTVVPNNKLGGGNNTSVVVNVDASGSDVQGDDAGAKELGGLISIAVQSELVKQQRPGGLLSSIR